VQTAQGFGHRYLREGDCSRHISSQKIHFNQNKRAQSGHKQGRKADKADRVRSGRHGQVRQAGPGQAGRARTGRRANKAATARSARARSARASGRRADKSGWSRSGIPADKAGGLTGQVG
jgi:hypothetical protein